MNFPLLSVHFYGTWCNDKNTGKIAPTIMQHKPTKCTLFIG